MLFNTVYGGKGGGGLPSEYQEVEWIASSGTQYILTNTKINSTQSIELKSSFVSNRGIWDKVFGGGDNGYTMYLQYNTNSTLLLRIYNNDTYIRNQGVTVSTGNIHIFKCNNTSFYMDDTLMGTCSASTFTMNTYMNIFANGNSNGNGLDKSALKLYYFKVFNSDNSLANDFVPCYRKNDTEIGLYDLVGKQFYTNQGTGTFTKGPDMN